MKKRALLGLASISIVLCMSACSVDVNNLIEDGKYEDALVLIEKTPDKYSDLYDEVKYKVAESEYESDNFERVIDLLENNSYQNALELLNEAKYNMASIFFQNGEYEKALNYLENNSYKLADALIDEINFKFAEDAVDAEDYDKAIDLLKDNECKEAPAMLVHVQSIKSAIGIEHFYKEMQKEMDEYNPDKWTPNFDYLEAEDFYVRIYDMLNDTYDTIIRDNSLDKAYDAYVDIFGCEPISVQKAKESISQMKEDLGFEECLDSPFYYYWVLDYVMVHLGRNSNNVRFEMTESSGFMIIENPYEFLKESSISAKTFAYLLGTCEGLGANIERDENRIIISYKNVHVDDYYSRGYYYCSPNSHAEKLYSYVSNMLFDNYDAYLDDEGFNVTIEFASTENYRLKYLSTEWVLMDTNGKHIESASKLLTDITTDKIVFDICFKGVTEDDFPDDTYSVHYFISPVLND